MSFVSQQKNPSYSFLASEKKNLQSSLSFDSGSKVDAVF